jgi:hypothetical protein
MLSLGYRGASAYGQKRAFGGLLPTFRHKPDFMGRLYSTHGLYPDIWTSIDDSGHLSATVDLCVGPVEAEGSGNLKWNRTNETTLLITHAELPFSKTIS